MNFNKLTTEEEKVIIYKATEIPFTGEYVNNREKGIYLCRRCDSPLFRSENKFDSDCGWPCFDNKHSEAVKHISNEDGSRIEITCSTCFAHLGHVYYGERYTDKNTRYCINSISLKFILEQKGANN